MKNPLLVLKEKEHKHALYTVLIVSMFTILFLLLVSVESPVKNTLNTEEVSEIEISFLTNSEKETAIEQATSLPPKSVENNSVNNTTSNEIAQNKTLTNVNEASQTFNFEASNKTESTDLKFGINGEKDIESTPERILKSTDRKVIKKPSFGVESQEEGSIKLKIWVNQNGEVVKTQVDPTGSNSGSQYLIEMAKKLAKTMKYEKKPGTATEYVGSKVFVFKKV